MLHALRTMSPTIAIIGSIVTDIVVQTPRIPASGENMHAPRIQVMTGGKAANAAVAFRRLGGRAHLLGNTGADGFGQQARVDLEAEGVDISGVGADPDQPTGSGVLLVEPDGQTAFIIAPGANLTLKPQQLEANLRPLLPHLDGLLFNFESPEACLLLAADLARAHDVPIFVDAGPDRPYSPELWRDAAILTPNQPEAEAIVGYPITDDESAVAAAQDLLARGPQSVVLKLGARGALLASADTIQHIPAFPITAVDSAGAGDAFTAGLTLAVLQGRALPQAVRFANACGAVAASRFGTMPAMPRLAEVEELRAAATATA
ncbi:MAG TPA: ribokinase [Caldilineae bacterium]|nr:ribokinase [Caldilineae bacterium]